MLSTATAPRSQARPKSSSPDRQLGYSFRTPPPRLVNALVRDKKLKRIDQDVLSVILDFRRNFRDSAWCSKSTIAEKLGCSERTVQRSLERLEQHKVILQVRTGPPGHPDPDEPRNQTGWRIYFLWITARVNLGPGPDRRPPEERTSLSSPERTGLSSPERTNLSSPPPAATIGSRAVFETQESQKEDDDELQDSAAQPAQIHPCIDQSSSSQSLSLSQTPTPSPVTPAEARAVEGSVCLPSPSATVDPVELDEQDELAKQVPASLLNDDELDSAPRNWSSSFSISLPQESRKANPGPPRPMPAPPSTELEIDQTELEIDQAEFGALAARIAAMFSITPEDARERLLFLIRKFSAMASRSGLEWGLWWLADVIDSARRRNKDRDKRSVEDWMKYLNCALLNKINEGGMPRPPAAKPKPVAPPAFDFAKFMKAMNELGWDLRPIPHAYGLSNDGIRWEKLRPDAETPNAEFHAIYKQNMAVIAELLLTQGGEPHASQ
jgi:hypothetical protein